MSMRDSDTKLCTGSIDALTSGDARMVARPVTEPSAQPVRRIRITDFFAAKRDARAVGDADQLRPVHRQPLRPGRGLGAAGRRLGRQQRLRLRDHPAGHRRRAVTPGPRGGEVHQTGLRDRRPALRFLRGRPVAGPGDRHPVHEGGRLPRGEVRGRRSGRRADPQSHRRGRPGDGPHRFHSAERAPTRRLSGAGPRRRRRPDCWPTLTPWPTPAPSAWCWRWCRAIWRGR